MSSNTPLALPAFRQTLRQWLPAAFSVTGALGLALYLACRGYQVDIDVYRMGGQHVLLSDLYSVRFANTGLLFTYPPFAALVFAVLGLNLGIWSLQCVWAVTNIVVLAALLYLSIRIVVPRLGRKVAVRWALLLLLPALALNPVFNTVGLGQINLVLCLLITWDLATDRRIGSRRVPLGIATGVAAGHKAHPAHLRAVSDHHPSYPRGPPLRHHVHRVRGDRLPHHPSRLMDLLDKGRLRLQARRCAALLERPEPFERSAEVASWSRLRLGARAGVGGDRYRRVGARSVGASEVVVRARASGVRDDRPDHLADHLGPPHGVGGAGDHLAGCRSRPAETRPVAGRIHRGAVRRRPHLVGAHVMEGHQSTRQSYIRTIGSSSPATPSCSPCSPSWLASRSCSCAEAMSRFGGCHLQPCSLTNSVSLFRLRGEAVLAKPASKKVRVSLVRGPRFGATGVDLGTEDLELVGSESSGGPAGQLRRSDGPPVPAGR